MADISALKITLTGYGQEHLLQFWDSLTDVEKVQLTDDIDSINFESVIADFKKVTSELKTDGKVDDHIKPVPKSLFGDINETSQETLKQYEDDGLRLIADSKLAVLVLAGGQGTRLGVSYPKGMYDVGLPSHKTLFQLQAERIQKLQNLACERHDKLGEITWFIMTSGPTVEATKEFFEKHEYFGLDRNNVIMFQQFLLPAFTFEGHVILQDKHRVSMSPDGNGGLYKALRDRKILDEMENRGIEFVHAFSIDNILTKVGDPLFVGFCVAQRSDCGVKVIEKLVPEESIGVVCMVNEKWQVLEYSEISEQNAAKRDEDGSLLFKAGNICNHMFSTKFLRRIAENFVPQLRLHIAKKKIPYVDSNGTQIKPKQPNGIKMEKFIFDVFPFSEKLVVWEVNRDEEFSALKNADDVGKDCPSTARQSVFRLHKKWIEKAGGKFDSEDVICEISPLVSYAGENLESLVKGNTFSSPTELKSHCD